MRLLLDRTDGLVRRGERSWATLDMQRDHARYISERLGGELPLAELDEAAVERFIAGEKEGRRRRFDGTVRPLNLRTVKARLSSLHLALSLARRAGLVSRVPEFPEIVSRYVPRQLYIRSYGQWLRLYRSMPIDRGDWCALVLWTAQHSGDVEGRVEDGKRVGGMRWRHVDPFGEKPSMIIRNTKNRKAAIRVTMPRDLVRILRRRYRAACKGVDGKPRLDQLIVPPWSTRGWMLPTYARRVGLGHLTATALRHTAGSWIVSRCGLTKAAAEWLGHSDLTMLMKVYAHALPAQLEEVSDALSAMSRQPEAPELEVADSIFTPPPRRRGRR